MSIRHLAVAALIAGASATQAQTVFTDNFDADALGLNKTTFAGGWTVGNGTVDVIGGNTSGAAANAIGYDFLPGNGNYIDLDGSNADAGVFTKTFAVLAGRIYTVTFALAGSQRVLGSPSDIVDVTFGTATTTTYTVSSGEGFSIRTLSFVAAANGSAALSFSNRGNDYAGALLDNVTITAVPEPSTYGLLFAGLAFVGYTARRNSLRR